MHCDDGHVCVSLCVSVPCCIPTQLHGPVTLGNNRKCSLVVHYWVDFGFTISVQVSLLWQHTRLMQHVSEDGAIDTKLGRPIVHDRTSACTNQGQKVKVRLAVSLVFSWHSVG